MAMSVRNLEEILAAIEDDSIKTDSSYAIENKSSYEKKRKKGLPSIKAIDNPLLVYVPLWIRFAFNPMEGKPDETYNEDNEFVYPQNPYEAITLLKYHCTKCKATFRYVKAAISEINPGWDPSNLEEVTKDDKDVFKALCDMQKRGLVTTTVKKKVVGGEYDVTVDLSGSGTILDNFKKLNELNTSLLIAHKMNLKEAVTTKNTGIYRGKLFSDNPNDMLLIDYNDKTNKVRQNWSQGINDLYPTSGIGSTVQIYALAFNAFNNGDIFDSSADKVSDDTFLDANEETLRAKEGYLRHSAKLREAFALYKKNSYPNQNLFGFMQLLITPPTGAKDMDATERGQATTYSVASATTFMADLVKTEMKGYRFEGAEEFEESITQYVAEREGLAEAFLEVLSVVCKPPTESMCEQICTFINSTIPLNYVYYNEEMYTRHKVALSYIYKAEFGELCLKLGLIDKEEVPEDDVKKITKNEAKTLAEISEEETADFDDDDFVVETAPTVDSKVEAPEVGTSNIM